MEPAVYTPVSAKDNLRRSTVIGVVLGVASIVVLGLLGHPLAGVFGLIGIGLGALNNVLLQRSVIGYAQTIDPTRTKFRGGVLKRLGIVTAAALVLAVLARPDGLGVFMGLAVFQILMLVGAAVPVFRSLRPTSTAS